MSIKILQKDLKTFATWWGVLAVFAWFAPLVLVLGVLKKHQNLEAWQIVLVLAFFLMLAGQYFMFRRWFTWSGLGKPAIYLPPQSMHWVAGAFGVEILLLFILDFFVGDAFFGGSVSTYAFAIWSLPFVLLFRYPKRDFPPASWLIALGIFFLVLPVPLFLNLFVFDDSLQIILRPLPSPLVWLAILGFLASCLKGGLLLVGFQRWRVDPGMEEDIKDRRRRFITMLSMLGFVVVFTLFGFASPRSGPQFFGLQPCGWLDIHLDRSHCMQSWYLGWDMDSPALSPDGQWLGTYDEVLKEVQIRLVESGELTARRSFEVFVDDDYAYPRLIFSPDGSLLLFSEHDAGVYLWDIVHDHLTPVAPVVGAERFGGFEFSGDGKELIFRLGDEYLVWGTSTYKTINKVGIAEPSYFQFLGDEKTILIRTKDQILSWDYLSSQEIVLVEELGERDSEVWSRSLYDTEGTAYTVMEVEDQFYLTYGEEFLHLPLEGIEVADLVARAPEEFRTERLGSGFIGNLDVALSPNGEFLVLVEDNWLSVHRTSDGAVLFWAYPCGREDNCYIRGLSINDGGLVLVSPSGNIQIWSVDN